MKLRFLLRFFSVPMRCNAFRAGVLAMALMFCCSTGFAQLSVYEIKLLDTIGKKNLPLYEALEKVTCFNTIDETHRVTLLVQRPGGNNGESWEDVVASGAVTSGHFVEWTHSRFPDAWVLNKALSGANPAGGWDTIVFDVTYSASTNRDSILSGDLTGTWYDGSGSPAGRAQAFIPLKPAMSEVDSIYIDILPLCQGELKFTARLNSGEPFKGLGYSQTGTEFYEEMYYHWSIERKDGTRLEQTLLQGDSVWTVHMGDLLREGDRFHANDFLKISVQRAFCNKGLFSATPGSLNAGLVPTRSRLFEPYDLVPNPPLDTVIQEDTIYRLAWWDKSLEGPGLSLSYIDLYGKWEYIPMDAPLCANYGQTMKPLNKVLEEDANYLPTGFVPSTEDYSLMQHSQGFLFLQVGLQPDTSVRYDWIYNPEVFERVFYDNNGAGNTWADGANYQNTRFGAYEDDRGRVLYPNGNGGFGQYFPPSGQQAGDTSHRQSWRAAFRVKSLTPQQLQQLNDDQFEIKVKAFCPRCSIQGQPFQNEIISTGYIGNPKYNGRPMDTIKPMTEFEIKKATSATGAFAPENSMKNCYSTTAYFQTTSSNTAIWRPDRLLENYNITEFKGNVQVGDGWGETDTTEFKDKTVTISTSPLDVRSTVVCTPRLGDRQIRPYCKYVTGANECFTRGTPIITLVGDTAFHATKTDSVWFQFLTFSVQGTPKKPLIYDSILAGFRTPCGINPETEEMECPDSIIICRNPILSPVGEPLKGVAARFHGVRYTLTNPTDTLVGSGAHFLYPMNTQHGFPSEYLSPDVLQEGKLQYEFYTSAMDFQNTEVTLAPVVDCPATGLLYFAAQNECGRSDSVVIPYTLTDTFSIPLDVTYNFEGIGSETLNWGDLESTLTCENAPLHFWVGENNYKSGYSTTWELPTGWSYVSKTPASGNSSHFHFNIGRDSGRINFHTVNHCGGNKGTLSPLLVPIKYYRANWQEKHDTVCYNSVYTYSLQSQREQLLNETPPSMQDLSIRFPEDWSIDGTFTGLNPQTDSTDSISINYLANEIYVYDSMYFNVLAGEASGAILVQWKNFICDVDRERPEWWDTLKIFTHTDPVPPLRRDGWKETDTVCARDSVWFSVKPDPKDSLQDNYYVWQFPEDWEVVDSLHNGDSMRVVTRAGITSSPDPDTIVVYVKSACCPQLEGDTLISYIRVWDTAVYDDNLIIDHLTGERFGIKPCEGDTLQLVVNKPNDVTSVVWEWGKNSSILTQNVEDGVVANGWAFVDNITQLLPDTLMFHSQEAYGMFDSLHIRMTMTNRCGPSRSPIKVFSVANKISESYNPEYYSFKDAVCYGEEVRFVLDSTKDDDLKYADKFIWTYSNAVEGEISVDTIYEVYSITLSIKDTGVLSVRPTNGCSPTTNAVDSVVKLVKRKPMAPVASFVRGIETLPAGDTLYFLDTICAQRTAEWRVQKHALDEALPYLEFRWMKLDFDTLQDPLFNLQTSEITHDSVHINPAGTTLRKKMLIGVAAVLEGCDVTGDTLKILLTSVDTASLADLDSISIAPLPNANGEYCAWSTITLSVNPVASLYHWILPEDTTYDFANRPDTAGAAVDMIVGQYPASRIGVLTGVSSTYCEPYTNQDTLWITQEQIVQPCPIPEISGFREFVDTVCEDITCVFRAIANDPNGRSRVYHWTFPEGWLNGKTDTITTADTIQITAGPSGRITVAGIDSCDGKANIGKIFADTIVVLSKPNFALLNMTDGMGRPCPEQEYTYKINASDPFISYRLEIKDINNESAVLKDTTIYAGMNPEVRFAIGTGDVSVQFLQISHRYCPAVNFPDQIKTLQPLTFPLQITLSKVADPTDISLSINSQDTVCQGDEQRYIATDAEGLIQKFVWRLPAGWDTLHFGNQSDTLRILFDGVLNNGSNLAKIQVNSHCEKDTSDHYHVFTMLDTVALPSSIFDAYQTDLQFSPKPCANDTVKLFVNWKNTRYDTAYWTWNNGTDITPTPEGDSLINGWFLYPGSQPSDTLSLLVPQNGDSLLVSLHVRNQCGTIRSHNYVLRPVNPINESLSFAYPTDSVALCLDNTVRFQLNPVTEAETYYWHFSWEPDVIDTVTDSLWNEFEATQAGYVWVMPANACGDSKLDFDTAIIKQIYQIPDIPTLNGKTPDVASVKDTACLRSSHTLVVSKHTADDFGVRFKWVNLDGETLDLSDLSAKGDTLTIPADEAFTGQLKTSVIGVMAINDSCDTPGDTLRVELTFVDTVPLSVLEFIYPAVYEDLCPGDEITISVYDTAPAYFWTLPATWSLNGDSATLYTNSINVKVGQEPGQFGIITLTDSAKRFCQIFAPEPRLSDTFTIRPKPVLDAVYFSLDTVCTTQEVTLFEETSYMFENSFAFEFSVKYQPDGQEEKDSITSVQQDASFKFIQPAVQGWTIGKVVAIDSFCTVPQYSDPLLDSFITFNPPNVELIGNMTPCRDSSVLYSIERSDAFVTFAFQYTKSENIVVESDSATYARVDFLGESGDSVQFVFYNVIHQYCESRVTDALPLNIPYTIKSDTAPNIILDIKAFEMIAGDQIYNRACLHDSVMFVANVAPGQGHTSSDVKSYNWVVPNFWRITDRIGEKQDTLIVVINEAMSYAPEQPDTLQIYAQGSCGTTKEPHKYHVEINEIPEATSIDFGNYGSFCEDSVITVWADTSNDKHVLKIHWQTPEIVEGTTNDTVRLALPKTDTLILSTRFRLEESCGFSKPREIKIPVVNQPAKPRFAQNLYPCKELPFGLSVVPDIWTDTIFWEFLTSAPERDTLKSERGYPHTQNDSLYFDNIGNVPFSILVRAENECGWRDTNITITPFNEIMSFDGDAMANFDTLRFCSENEVVGYVKIPSQHVLSEPIYQWTLPQGWTFVKDSIVILDNPEHDSVNMVWFIPDHDRTHAGMISVIARSQNNCGGDVFVETFNECVPTVLYLELGQTHDTVEYKYSETRFFADSVAVDEVADNLKNFNFTWTPALRFNSETSNSDTVRLLYAYMAEEEFVVEARENHTLMEIATGQECYITDTVHLIVDGSYSAKAEYPESVCDAWEYELIVHHQGGEPESYNQKWYKRTNPVDPIYVPFNPGITDTIMEDVLSIGDSTHYMIVVTDSLFSGADTKVEVADTLYFAVLRAKPLSAKITKARLVQVVGDQVRELSEEDMIGDSIFIKLGERVRLTAEVDGNGRPDDQFYFYEWWSLEDEQWPKNQNDTSEAITEVLFYPHTFYMIASDTLAPGCFSGDTIHVGMMLNSTNDKDVFGIVPGGFSPCNQDNINDIFMKEVNELTIIDRRGVIIYQALDEQAKKGWDGRDSKAKRMVDRGDYFYIITIYEENDRNKKHTKTGVVSVF